MSRIIHGDSHKAIKYFREKSAALEVLMVYIGRANREGVAWPSLKGLAHDTDWNKTTCSNARRFLIEHGALEEVPDYLRPAWRNKSPAELAKLKNLDHSEYYRVTGVFLQDGKSYPFLYIPSGEESDLSDPSDDASTSYGVGQRPDRPSTPSSVDGVDGRPGGTELDSNKDSQLDSSKTKLDSTPLELDSTTTTGSGDSARAMLAATEADVVVDDLALILPEIRKLSLTQSAQAELLAKGAEYALAVAWAAQGPGARYPAGLAMKMLHDGGPPDLNLEQARIALETGVIDQAAADRALRQRELTALQERAQELTAAQESTEPPPELPPAHAESAPDPGPGAPDGLGEKPPGSRLTWREIWAATLVQLRMQLNASTYSNWIDGAKAISFTDGVLAIQARHVAARDAIESQYRETVEFNVRRFAGATEIRIVFVAAPALEVAQSGKVRT